jgi:hypothetical protein
MARYRGEESNPGCHDSFLDVVTNIVGILIILVVVAGLRAKNAPVHASVVTDSRLDAAEEDLQKDLAAEQSVRRDIFRMVEQVRAVEREGLLRFQQREELATLLSLLEHQLKTHREQLDAKAREDFDLARLLAEARQKLQAIERERQQVEASESEPILVENYPTPLSKTVDGDETHFQLRGGRIAYIPLKRLLDRFKADAQRQIYKLLDLPEFSDTVGPEGGFRLRYVMEREDARPEAQLQRGHGAYAQLKQWSLVPVSSEIGEPIEAALAEGSNFRQTLASLRPGTTTVTVWIYPDSFDEFRQLRKELYRLNYPVAGRPLPEGTPIGGSPKGSKSAVE